VLRNRDYNVTFGIPQHRCAEGGPPCEGAFAGLLQTAQTEFRDHDPLVQALALHYHLAAMHPFLDGNGRTARAMEALLRRRAGLTDRAFIAMSNYYHDEKPAYLRVLSEVWQGGHDLTPFLIFALQGVRNQCERLTAEIRKQMQRALFCDTMFNLSHRLESKRKRVISARQVEVLKILIEEEVLQTNDLFLRVRPFYASLKNMVPALSRDFRQLEDIGPFTRSGPLRVPTQIEFPSTRTGRKRSTKTNFFGG
jgi:Fic family protein